METNQDESREAARRQELLARFGDRAGKHGARAERRIPIMLRVPPATDARASFMSQSLGVRKAQFVLQAVNVFCACQPANWYSAIASFQKASGGAVALPDWFEFDDRNRPEYEPAHEVDPASRVPAARRVCH